MTESIRTQSPPDHRDASFSYAAAALYRIYRDYVPEHPGKQRLIRLLYKAIFASSQFVTWPMRNHLRMAIASWDLFAGCGVGWTCFERGEWEPHVEHCLRSFLRPGDVAIDIGSNLGYFTSVMASCVGANGRVHSFEPVPVTFSQLQATCQFNRFVQTQLYNIAIGDKKQSIELTFNRSILGNASSVHRPGSQPTERVVVPMETLDGLYADGKIGRAQIIKIDVEGHELAALRGGFQYIKQTRPAILFEFNAETSQAAGWNLYDVADFLQAIGDYSCFMVTGEGFRIPSSLRDLQVPMGAYIDILAVPQA